MEKCEFENATIYCGDCKELDISADACVTDPPYGCGNNCDYTRFKGGKFKATARKHPPVIGDSQPFDPTPFLKFPKVCLWGFNHFANRLPLGTVLVWNKKRQHTLGTFLSDCELAWVAGGKGVYLFNHIWSGVDRQSERGKFLHPTQKPVALFRWVFERLKLKPGQTVYDPFMGSGACGVAALEAGLKYVGVEIDPLYFEVAKTRISRQSEA